MDLVFSVPYIFRIIISLGAILLFQRLVKSLEAALALGTFTLALWTGHSPAAIARISGERIFSLDMLFLLLVVAGVIWLSSLMSEGGIMRDLVKCLKARLSYRGVVALLPAVVGLLPMPAGAIFSAPLLDDADEARVLDPLQKSRINYWFRHIWEFWWPLYPGVLLAADISGLPLWQFAGIFLPLSLGAAAAGYFSFLIKTPKGKEADRQGKGPAFIPLILPIITVIAVYGLLLALCPALNRIDKSLPMFIGVVCGIVVIQIRRPATGAVWKRVIFSRRTASLLLILALTRLYGAFIEARLPGGEVLMEQVQRELDTFGIPVLLLILIIPFISGLTTAITVGYIGASFPVVMSLAGAGPARYSFMIIGYAAGFVGMMFSPIHTCLIVTNRYYKTNLLESLRGMLLPGTILFVFAAAYALFWRVLG
jgi:integral membrane protein (TIGR00529 family)